MADRRHLEFVCDELIKIYDIRNPPVPVESMLQHPLEGMWEELDINKLSGSFINVTDHYSPRMSLARLLARHIIGSPWGKERGLDGKVVDEDVHTFARILMMPSRMVLALSKPARTPERLSIHFEVPIEDAEIRLKDLDTHR